jgi:hypothetical protein
MEAIMDETHISTMELKEMFFRSRLWRYGWTFEKAIRTDLVLRMMQNGAMAMRIRMEKQEPKAPSQMSLI